MASEVKELATQTSSATEDIGKRISAIQGDTQASVTAIDEISAIIGKINELSTTIAGAVEEQSATTNDIGRSVHEASSAVGDISSKVAKAADETASGSVENRKASNDLARRASGLQEAVSRFKCKA